MDLTIHATKRDEAQDPVTQLLISTYANFMNDRLIQAIGYFVDPALKEKLPQLGYPFYYPIAFERKKIEEMFSAYQATAIFVKLARNVGSQNLSNTPAVVEKNIRTILEFAEYQERVYVRKARSMKELMGQTGISIENLLAKQDYLDQITFHSFGNQKQAFKFYQNAAEAQDSWYIAVRHIVSTFKRTNVQGPILTELEAKELKSATLDFIGSDLNRIFPT